MVDTQTIQVTLPPGTAREFVELVRSCYQKNPSKADLKALRKQLDETPELYRAVFDLSGAVQSKLTEKVIAHQTAQAGINAHIGLLRREMGYDQAPMLEKLLIESVVNSWLNYQWAELEYIQFTSGKHSMREGEYWSGALNAAQRRYLRACETLAKVRKLTGATFQVNIAQPGSQQLNVAGNLVKSGE
jgi:hypothetical protein